MATQQFYGWFDDETQRVPSFDPPHDAPCLFCGCRIKESDVRTHSIMMSGPVYAKRSYFYRTHSSCAEADKSENGMDGIIFDMITRNGD